MSTYREQFYHGGRVQLLRIQLKRALLLHVGLYYFAWGSIALRRTLEGLKSKNMHQKCLLSEHLQFSSSSPPNTFSKYMGRVQSCTAWSPLSFNASSLWIGIRSIAGGYSIARSRITENCMAEGSIAQSRVLLWNTLLWKTFYTPSVYAHRLFLDSTLLSMKTRKLSSHDHDTTVHDCSVLPTIEELLIPIGFRRGVESRISFY